MKKMSRKSKHIVSVVLFTLILGSCAVHRFTEFSQNDIHHFNMAKIGDVRQAVLINGSDLNNPVLVFLHGGPGFPMLPFAPFSSHMHQLEDHFTIVYWEQRGTGRSFFPGLDPETMNVDQFISDTKEVVEYAKKITGQDKVYLWGHSWGSNIGALYAAKYPENLHAYMSTGQSVNPFLNERLAYEFVLENALKYNNSRALKDLSTIDTIPENYKLSDALTLRKWVYRYGGIVYDNQSSRPYVDIEEIQTILLSSVYTIRNRIHLLRNPHFSAHHLWADLKQINLKEQAPKINVPVFFFVGRHDIIVSHVLAEKYFDILIAPQGKDIFWFEESAHRPFAEETEKFLDLVIEYILPLHPNFSNKN